MQDVHRAGAGVGSGGMNFLDREVGLAEEGVGDLSLPRYSTKIPSISFSTQNKMVLMPSLTVLLCVFGKVGSNQQCAETRRSLKGNPRNLPNGPSV